MFYCKRTLDLIVSRTSKKWPREDRTVTEDEFTTSIPKFVRSYPTLEDVLLDVRDHP